VRVLVSTTAGAGHFGPLIPFARACSSAGHEVVVAAPESFRSQVVAAGLEHQAFPDAPAELMGPIFERVPLLSFEQANEVVVTEVFGRLDAQAAFPGLVGIIERWRPDVVLREPSEFGSLVAGLAAGVPLVDVAIGVVATTEYMVPHLVDPLAELSALAGIPERVAIDAVLSTPTLTVVPDALDEALGTHSSGDTHRFHDVSLDGRSGELPGAWGDPAHPLLYVSFGSIAAGLPGFAQVYPEVVSAFAERPVRVLLTTDRAVDPDDLGAPPANVRVEQWWPQSEVMRHCSAMVGHGGFGTTMAGLAGGVPQVVVPLFSFDQRVNAEHLAAVGAGLHVEGGPGAMSAAADAAARLVEEPAFREAARAVADDMAALPPVSEAVGLLERSTGSGP